MIVDGAEVLYTMRNGKIVDPNIPTDGLVCCLDTRGKNNTDIYRNTLLDLSGNGNHGTLQNFNFTEESGYVKDLSGGGTSGLKFDGVDDRLILQKEVYVSNINSTVYASGKMYNIIDQNSFRTLFALGNIGERFEGHFYWIYTDASGGGGGVTMQFYSEDSLTKVTRLITNVGSEIELKVVLRLTDNEIYVNVNGLVETIPQNPIEQELKLRIGAYVDSAMEVDYMPTLNLGNLKAWNRALTDEEITKLMEV